VSECNTKINLTVSVTKVQVTNKQPKIIVNKNNKHSVVKTTVTHTKITVNDPVKTIKTIGIQGVPGVSGDKHYKHQQGVSALVWSVAHNLIKFPAITIVDSAGTEVIGDINYIDLNNVEITFSAPFSGLAYFN